MALVRCFNDLPDLVLMELFSYLSSIDILWGFTNLNQRLTMLIIERGFFYHINLSLSHYHKFNRILHFLPLNDIQSLSLDSDASPLQLTHWPYLPSLRILHIIGAYNHDHLLLFLLLHAATLTHLIIKSNERLVPDGFSIKFEYPTGDMTQLIKNILFIHLPALRSIDLGMNYYGTRWSITSTIVPLTYIRLSVPSTDILVRLMSTSPLSKTLRQLHIGLTYNCSPKSISNLSISMMNLHTFTLVQTFFSRFPIEWTFFEMITSSKVMPVLRRANISLLININDLNRIDSSPIFSDHRHVDINFALNVLNCPQYSKMTEYIPRGHSFHPREIVGATFVVNRRSGRSEWLTDGDPFSHGCIYYHHMWYTLPWVFDEFFHEYLPEKWITKIEVFQGPSHNTTIIDSSSLRTLDASGQNLTSSIWSLPHLTLSDRITTFHLSYYNRSISINLSALRNLTLVNSIDCLNNNSFFPPTLRSIRILLFYYYPNYMTPNWPVVLHSLLKLLQLSSVRIFMYDIPKTIDQRSCQTIAEIASLFTDFGFCFRRKHSSWKDFDIDSVFNDHIKFINQLCHHILLLSFNKQPYYSIEDDGCGLAVWF